MCELKMVKALSFTDVLDEVRKKQEEFEALPPEEQKRIREEQAKAIEEFYANGGTATGLFVGKGRR